MRNSLRSFTALLLEGFSATAASRAVFTLRASWNAETRFPRPALIP